MSTHILKIDDLTTFKELGLFVNDKNIIEGDEIILDINVTYTFDFIFRHVLFLIIRGGVSNNRQKQNLNRLPESKQNFTEFWEHENFAQALMEDTGVLVSLK